MPIQRIGQTALHPNLAENRPGRCGSNIQPMKEKTIRLAAISADTIRITKNSSGNPTGKANKKKKEIARPDCLADFSENQIGRANQNFRIKFEGRVKIFNLSVDN